MIELPTRPKLQRPKPPPQGSFKPSRYFSKGKEPQPSPLIWHLLTESLESATPIPVPHNIGLIKSLCKGTGELKKNERGLVFLDIDNRFINTLAPYFEPLGLQKPPYFNIFGLLQGAHIPVIPKRESDFNFLSLYKELGMEFSFEIEGLYSLMPDSWPEMEQVWFLKVRSPELEAFRRCYFLPSLPSGHSFHIVVAIKPRKKDPAPRPTPYMRVNPSFFPV
jgi:hypothetical protein